MNAALAIALFAGIVFLACAAVALLGTLISRQLRRRAPENRALRSLTPTGIALSACLVAVMVFGAAARKLAPESVLGSFLGSERGILVAFGTELVDGEAIRAFKEGRVYDWAEWTRERFISSLAERIDAKNKRYPFLKDPPYEGGYIVVVHTDEPELTRSTVQDYLNAHGIPRPEHVSRVMLVLSYDAAIQRCPYFEVPFNG